MDVDELLERIGVHADIMVGKPCVRGTRIPVYLVLRMLGGGMSINEIVAEYPSLSQPDVLACLAYAGALLDPIRLENPTVDFDLSREREAWR